MDKVVITISREYCSGGLKVGKLLAEDLGIACYDSEMFHLVSTSTNMKKSLAEQDDRIRDTSLYAIASEKYEGNLPSETDELVDLKNIYNYQSEIIRSLADKESCVIVGRCSNYILRDRKDTTSIFVHASIDFRMKRASTVHNMETEELRTYIHKMDQKKADYYMNYTGEDWYNVTGYELSMDTGRYGIRGTVDKIEAYLKTYMK